MPSGAGVLGRMVGAGAGEGAMRGGCERRGDNEAD
jgi:hypothetical protein